jgi:glycoprotease family protein
VRGLTQMTERDRWDGGRVLLAMDTATSQVVVATGSVDGEPTSLAIWAAGHRHSETLLPTIVRVLAEQNSHRSRLGGIIVGTGPGTFTGLRVGLATAKGLAHGLGIPIAGVPTAAALLDAAARDTGSAESTGSASAAATGPAAAGSVAAGFALLLPAGPQDRVLVHGGRATHLPAGTEPDIPAWTTLVAVDLPGRAPLDALARGEAALRGLGPALLRLGARRLAAGNSDDLARLVPEYVTLPRGINRETGEVAWSRDPR